MFGKKKDNENLTTLFYEVIPPTVPIHTDTAENTAPSPQEGVTLPVTGGTAFNMTIGNCSSQGARNYQEDSFAFSDITRCSEKGFAAVLSDGMGGLSGGKEVSEYVVSSFISMLESVDYSAPFGEQFRTIAKQINKEICASFYRNGESGAGATLAAVFFYAGKFHWVCAGDSRLYVLRGGRLFAVNEDHTYLNQLLGEYLEGERELESIGGESQKDSLTSFMGNQKLEFIDYSKNGFSVLNGDTFILCSDGVYNGIGEDETVALINTDRPQESCERITNAVLEKNIPGQDNLTILMMNFGLKA